MAGRPKTAARGRKGRRTSAETREHVLEVADALFYWHGVHAIGVDRIAAEAAIAPTTLYRLFASKDDLVAAYVERASQRYRERLDAVIVAGGTDPARRILAVFDALRKEVQPSECRGCLFLMALSEFPDMDVLAHEQAVEIKRWVRDRFGDLTRDLAAVAPVKDPAALADQLVLIMEGVYASVQALGIDGPARQARALVEAILPGTPTIRREDKHARATAAVVRDREHPRRRQRS